MHKKEDKTLIKNDHPITLLAIFDKIFERVTYNSLFNYFLSNKLSRLLNQVFFQETQLLSIIHEMQTAFDNISTLDVRGVFLDISKALDKVWHAGLVFKLKSFGVEGELLSLLKNYLQNREQRLVLNGQISGWRKINSSVPQGFVLEPLLFLIYINDLHDGITSMCKIFAGDTYLFSKVLDIDKSVTKLNTDLKKISQWTYQWKMQFNPDPNKQANEIIF